MIITLADVRKATPMKAVYCNRGIRVWLDKYGLSWTDLITTGIDASVVKDIPDPMLKKVLANAQERTGGR